MFERFLQGCAKASCNARWEMVDKNQNVELLTQMTEKKLHTHAQKNSNFESP